MYIYIYYIQGLFLYTDIQLCSEKQKHEVLNGLSRGNRLSCETPASWWFPTYPNILLVEQKADLPSCWGDMLVVTMFGMPPPRPSNSQYQDCDGLCTTLWSSEPDTAQRCRVCPGDVFFGLAGMQTCAADAAFCFGETRQLCWKTSSGKKRTPRKK